MDKSSKQYSLSDILLDKRYELGLEFSEVAKIVGLSEDEYINYEYGDTSIPVGDYQTAIEKIRIHEDELRRKQ